MRAGVAVVTTTEGIDEILVAIAVLQVAVSKRTDASLVIVTNNLGGEALRNNSEGDCLVFDVIGLVGMWVFAAIIANVRGPDNEGLRAHLAVVRSLETDYVPTGRV